MYPLSASKMLIIPVWEMVWQTKPAGGTSELGESFVQQGDSLVAEVGLLCVSFVVTKT